MPNSYYNPSASPVQNGAGSSKTIRDEFNNIGAGFAAVEAAIAGVVVGAVPVATTSVSGSVILATDGDAAAGTNTAKAMTPAAAKSVTDLLAPKASPTFTGTVTADGFAGPLVGNVTGNVTGNTSGSSGSCTGNAATATNATNHIAAVTGAEHGAVSTKTANKIVRRDSSGAAALDVTGNVTGNVTGSSGSCTGNAATTTLAADSSKLGGQLPAHYHDAANLTGVAPLASIPATPYIYVREEQAANVDGGTFTAGAWRTRVLNTEVADTAAIASLASNRVTLPAGTYEFLGAAPAYGVGASMLRLQNITDAVEVEHGMSSNCSPTYNGSLVATVKGVFTITGSKAFELQHYCVTTQGTNGFGYAVNIAGVTEVYAELEFWKVA